MERTEGNREMSSLSIGIRSDLVQRLMKHSRNHDGIEREEGDEELELSLGLSMNGRFGVDPARKRLKRSSSISNLVFAVGAADNGSCSHEAGEVEEFDTYATLSRTRSLPTEVEEEWRRRKEFQSMRQMEARKKRMEKLRNVVEKDKENCCEDGNGFHEAVNRNSIDNRIINKFENGNEISSSQGSIGSQRSGSGSSGISDLELEGGISQKADMPPPTTRPSQDQNDPEPGRETGPTGLNPLNKSLKNTMFEMPYVSTKENGPDGHKIKGFLYSHKKGEDVRIVCVCHGTFLTPTEFVKHGGGGDVEHPLKHIVVHPFPLL